MTALFRAALPTLCVMAGLAWAQAPAETPAGEHDHGAPRAAAAQDATPGSTRPRTPAPRDAIVYIGWPQNGTVVRSTRFKVWFGLRGLGVAPAGVRVPGTGHHHLLVDTPLPTDMNAEIPNDKQHLHFGLGQTETVLELPPGTHTLQLLMGDADHVPHDPPLYSPVITIYVRPGPTGTSVSSAP